jgi:hypothetical protein
VRVDATQRVKIDVAMEVGVLTESVTITGGASLVATQNTELGVVIGEEQVRNLPLNGRNFAQLIALEPGAVVSGGAVYFNGLSRDGMNISVDGTDAANPDRPSTTDFGGQTQQNILSVEFIEEFKTSKASFPRSSDARRQAASTSSPSPAQTPFMARSLSSCGTTSWTPGIFSRWRKTNYG